MTMNFHGHRSGARSFSGLAEEKCVCFGRETLVLQRQPSSYTIFNWD